MHELTIQQRYDARGYMFLPQRRCSQCRHWRDLKSFGQQRSTLKDGTYKYSPKRRCKCCESENKKAR